MLFATVGQWRVFAVMAAAGAAVGVLYDLMAVCARLLGAGRILSALLDLVLGAAAAAMIAAALTFANDGEARAFAFVAVALGAALYFGGLHRLLRAVCKWIVRLIRQTYRRIAQFRLIKVIFR